MFELLNQSGARKRCFLASDWLRYGTVPQKLPYSSVYEVKWRLECLEIGDGVIELTFVKYLSI